MSSDPVASTSLPLPLHRRGKVRDVYDLGDALLLVATDRISAFDVVLSPGIAGKGVVLTQISNFWFRRFPDITNHLIATELADFPDALRGHGELRGRAVVAKKCEVVPVECVARGYLAGSGWKEYRENGAVCGVALPAGLRQASKLPEPIFTPATKADEGHDENIPFERMCDLVGSGLASQLRDLTLRIYSEAAAYARERGVIIADTKFEFGILDGKIVWIDEALTPDSSRFWPEAGYREGANPPSFDKQFVRDWLESTGWDKTPPAPELPADVVTKTLGKYVEAYRLLTGSELALP
ncbi:MAG: phosphoribosylaminoimidazolesuccinocarboxamide synthase [Thermoanaerobaculia bacterium]|nr:phosphoribosylaminoimidazolesuccinocarboxamide synthase [Thermoanaerobaculia bacterium]